MKIKTVLIQKPHDSTITHRDADDIRNYGPHFVCFPEYFFTNNSLGHHVQTLHNYNKQLKRIEVISKSLNTVVIGGTMHEPENGKLYNTSFVFDRGRLLGSYRKQNLFFTEYDDITPGSEYTVFSAYGITFGVLICADVFKEESFQEMKRLGAKIIFIPTISPGRVETVEEKYERDNEIFVNGAVLSDAVIVKVCAVKSKYREYLQARSLIADKNGILYRVKPDEEEKEMIIKKEIEI